MNATHVTLIPNHHAGQGRFRGFPGLLVATTMAFGRSHDAAWAIELTRPSAGSSIVDIGCGPGQAARIAARRGLRATGVDPSRDMLRLARWLGRSGRLTWVEGSAEALPVDSGSADACWSIASVHHWSDLEAGVREARRILAPGRRFVAIERSVGDGATGLASHGWSAAQASAFAEVCRAAGFTAVRIEHRSVRRRRDLVAVVATLPA